jgi:hypothetical protein
MQESCMCGSVRGAPGQPTSLPRHKHCRIPCKTMMQDIGKCKTNQLLSVSALTF